VAASSQLHRYKCPLDAEAAVAGAVARASLLSSIPYRLYGAWPGESTSGVLCWNGMLSLSQHGSDRSGPHIAHAHSTVDPTGWSSDYPHAATYGPFRPYGPFRIIVLDLLDHMYHTHPTPPTPTQQASHPTHPHPGDFAPQTQIPADPWYPVLATSLASFVLHGIPFCWCFAGVRVFRNLTCFLFCGNAVHIAATKRPLCAR
jgi:hypothetical protein